MKHKYVIYLFVLSFLLCLFAFPVSAAESKAMSVLDFPYKYYTVDGTTYITVNILDIAHYFHYVVTDQNGSVIYESWNSEGNSFDFPMYPADLNYNSRLDFYTSSIYLTDIPLNSLVNFSATWSSDAPAYTTPTATFYVDEYTSSGDHNTVYTFNVGSFPEGEKYSFGPWLYSGPSSSRFNFWVYLHNMMALTQETYTATLRIDTFDITFSLESLYFDQIQSGKTNQLLEDLKNSNKEISDKIDELANAIEPAPGAGEDAKDNSVIQGGKIDDLNGQMGELVKPDMSGQGSISHIISPGDLTSYTTFLSSLVNAPYISQVVMLALILSLAAYVLFGKRG